MKVFAEMAIHFPNYRAPLLFPQAARVAGKTKKSEKMGKRGLTSGADCSTISLVDDTGMESWLSGLRRTTGNRVYVDSVSRVQIPNSPPTKSSCFDTKHEDFFLHL